MTGRLLFAILLAGGIHDDVARGNAAYRAGRYGEAVAAYRGAVAAAPNEPGAWFDLGDALYRQHDFAAAGQSWERAARASGDSSFIARCRYNQGNAAYRQAEKLASADVAQAISGLERAAKAYSIAIEVDPQFMAARYNLDAAREFIRRLQARSNPGPDPNEVLKQDSTRRPSHRPASTAEKDW